MLAVVSPSAGWVWIATLCNLGSVGVFLGVRQRLSAPLRLTAVALLLAYVLNYHGQIFLVDWLYHSPSFDSLWREFSLLRLDGSIEAHTETIYQITAIFALVCSALTAFACIWGEAAQPSGPFQTVLPRATQGAQALWVIFAFGCGAALLGLLVQFTFGVGALTAEKAFAGRLDGVLHHSLVTLAPLLFMAIHWEGIRQGHVTLARVSLAAYAALAIAEMAMMSSRGFMVLQMLPLVLLYLWMGIPGRRILMVGAITALLTLLLYPVMTAVRTLRSVSGYGALDSIETALSAGNDGGGLSDNFVRISARFVGYTSYLTSLERPDDRFDWSYLDFERILTLRENGFTRWFTEQIAGYGAGIHGHFSSPGLLGAAQVIGGPVLVVLVPPLFALLTMFAVRLIQGRAWRLGPLVPVNVLAALLFLFEEGVFDLIFTRLILVTFSLVLLSWLFRLAVPIPAAVLTCSALKGSCSYDFRPPDQGHAAPLLPGQTPPAEHVHPARGRTDGGGPRLPVPA